MLFQNRTEAGQKLAAELGKKSYPNALILAIPRGGVIVGFEIAKTLKIPLEVIIARKIGAPHNPEFGIGAISEENTTYLEKETIQSFGISKNELNKIKEENQQEIDRRISLYRKGKPLSFLKNRTIILVDDGLATGVTAMAAIKFIKQKDPKEIIFALPVCSYQSALKVRKENVKIVSLLEPTNLEAIGTYYHDFSQVTDEEVLEILQKSRK